MLEKSDKKPKTRSAYLAVGLVLVFIGSGYLLGTLLHQTWVYFGTLTVCGIIMLAYGFSLNSEGFKIAGTLVFGIGIGTLILLNEKIEANTEVLIGSGLLIFSIFWMILAIILGGTKNITRLWPLIPAGVILPFSIIFLFEKTNFLFFVLAGGISSGCTLLGWGLISKMVWIGNPREYFGNNRSWCVFCLET